MHPNHIFDGHKFPHLDLKADPTYVGIFRTSQGDTDFSELKYAAVLYPQLMTLSYRYLMYML